MGRKLGGLAAAVAAIALLAPAGASADQIVCPAGAGAGQCDSPAGLAIDRSEALLYVADRVNRRVNVFEADGTFLFSHGSAGTEAGQFTGMAGIAVDNDPGSPSLHSVYVLEAGSSNRRVQKFTPSGEFVWMVGADVNKTKVGESAPEAQRNLCTAASGDVCGNGLSGFGPGELETPRGVGVGPGGVVQVLDHRSLGGGQFEKRVQRFGPEGEALGQAILENAPAGQALAFAVESTGAFYMANSGVGGGVPAVRKYDEAGTPLATFHESFNIQALAVDGEDNLLVGDSSGQFPNGEGGAETAIYLYDDAAPPTPIRTLYGTGTLLRRPVALEAFSNASGDVFAAESTTSPGLGRVVQVAFPPPGPVIPDDPSLLRAEPIGNVRATLRAAVNPEGAATEVRFQYVDDASYQSEGGFASPDTAVTPWSAPTEPKFKLIEASTEVLCDSAEPDGPTCLAPFTTYHFKAEAKNADGETIGPEAEFTTGPTIELGEAWSTDVGIGAATVHTSLDPLSLPTSGFFEYVTEQAHEASGFATAARAPAGSGVIDFGSGEGTTSRSATPTGLAPDTTYRYRLIASNFFETFTGPEASFTTFPPSPPDRADCPNQAFRTGAGAALPNCRGYEMVSPADKNNGDIISPAGTNLSRPATIYQSAASGEALTYSSATAFADAETAPFVSQYLARRGAGGWSSESISPARERNVEPGVPDGGRNNQYRAFSEDLGSGWLQHEFDPPLGEPPGVEGFWNIYRRDNSSGAYEAITRVAPPSAPASGTGAYRPLLQGFSADGATAVYQAKDKLTAEAAACCNAQLYLHEGGTEPRLASVLPSGAASGQEASAGSGAGTPNLWSDSLANALSEDGERLYWTASEGGGATGKLRVRVNAGEPQSAVAGGECTEAQKACTLAVSGKVSPLLDAYFWAATPDGGRAIFTIDDDLYRYELASESVEHLAGGVQGIAGASEDLARIYVISEAALAAGASAGQPNLYLDEEGAGEPEFIATLAADDVASGFTLGDQRPDRRTARTSADGATIAFAARGALTGYDNADALTGKADREVYRYDVAAGLDCVSCNPSGARPRGRELGSLVGGPTAAQIPTWQTSLSAQRVLSADGRRLFFESFDALLPRDTNGKMDVYQWEATGSGECEAGAGNHFPSNGGCLSLISSGKSAGDSHYVDASASGADVFFTTESSLVGGDEGLVDVYDARIGGGFPPPPPPPVACEGDACQAPAAAPEAPTPASATFAGAGNVAAPAVNRCRRPARAAQRLSKRAKRLARAARRSRGARRARGLGRRSARLARSAKRRSRAAKRCRTRVRAAARRGANANRGGSR